MDYMCGRFNNHLPKMLGWTELLQHWPELHASFNIAPTAQIAVFGADPSVLATGQAMRWGMVPSWSNEFNSRYATFNARLETVAEKPTFRSAWRKQQRCLIPMAGYYEWQTSADGKQPFYISDKNVGGIVAAGLYEQWGDLEQPHLSCTIITRPADLNLSAIHARMPVMLTPQTANEWLSTPVSHSKALLEELDSPDIVYWPVTKAVGNTRNDGPDLCQAIDLHKPNPE